jgi:hypothetical protein
MRWLSAALPCPNASAPNQGARQMAKTEDDLYVPPEDRGYKPAITELMDAARVLDTAFSTLNPDKIGMFDGQGERVSVWVQPKGVPHMTGAWVSEILQAADMVNAAIAAYPGLSYIWDGDGFELLIRPERN